MDTLLVGIGCLIIGALYHAYITRQLVKLDKWINWQLLGGIEGETISSRAGRILKAHAQGQYAAGVWQWCLLCKFLDIFDKDHCIENIQTVPGRPND